LKPERWGSLLVQETYQEEKACDKRHTHTIIIIIISALKVTILTSTGFIASGIKLPALKYNRK
jgi:hypothetical protein